MVFVFNRFFININVFSFFGSRRIKPKTEKASYNNDEPFGFFDSRRKTTTRDGSTATQARTKKILKDDGDDGVFFNFNQPTWLKKKAAAKKTDDKKKAAQAAAAGKKKPVQAANAKKKKIEQAAATAKKPQPDAAVIKKKKLEEATATPGPVFGQQVP